MQVTEIDHWLSDAAYKYRAKSSYLSAGKTYQPLYAHWRQKPHPLLKSLILLQLDDIKEGERKGEFARFFRKELPAYTVHAPEKDVQADLAILGFGVNGHVAFHEPHVPRTFRFGDVALESETAKSLGVPAGTKVVTFGIGALMETKAILLVVSGNNKRAAYLRFLRGDKHIPAAALRKHHDLTVITDFH